MRFQPSFASSNPSQQMYMSGTVSVDFVLEYWKSLVDKMNSSERSAYNLAVRDVKIGNALYQLDKCADRTGSPKVLAPLSYAIVNKQLTTLPSYSSLNRAYITAAGTQTQSLWWAKVRAFLAAFVFSKKNYEALNNAFSFSEQTSLRSRMASADQRAFDTAKTNHDYATMFNLLTAAKASGSGASGGGLNFQQSGVVGQTGFSTRSRMQLTGTRQVDTGTGQEPVVEEVIQEVVSEDLPVEVMPEGVLTAAEPPKSFPWLLVGGGVGVLAVGFLLYRMSK